MPWTAKDAKGKTKKADTPAKQKKWAKIANSALATCLKGGESQKVCEGRAIRIANAAIAEEGRVMDKILEALEQLRQAVIRYMKGDDGQECSERAIGFSRVYEQFYVLLREAGDDWPRIMDIYLDDGQMYGLVTSAGKLFRYALTVTGDDVEIIGDPDQVMEIHPSTEARSHVSVYRQADGRLRFTAVACTAILNRIGCIDSTALFDNMIRHAEESGQYPYATLWHLGEEFRVGLADLLLRDGVVYLVSGLFDEENELAESLARDFEADPDFWGTSIRFKPLSEPEMVDVTDELAIPVYNDGIHQELSFLPENRAASLYTSAGVIPQQEVERMKPELEALLRKVLPEDSADEWIAKVDDINRAAEEPGVVSRDGEQDEVTGEPQEKVTPPTEGEEDKTQAQETDQEPTMVLDDAAIGAIVTQMAESPEMTSLFAPLTEIQAQVEQLVKGLESARAAATEGLVQVRERLDLLERTDEEKQREWVADLPARRVTQVTYRPRHANDPTRPKGNGGQERGPSYADVAESTLANMPQYGKR